jgi:hypothetical protein
MWSNLWDGGAQYAIKLFGAQEVFSRKKAQKS